MKIIWYILWFSCIAIQVNAQTCCTAGAPIVSGLNINSNTNQNFHIGISYDFRSINRLIQNNEVLINDPRSRVSQSTLVNVNYTLGPRFAIGVLLPSIFHLRQTISEEEKSLGLGDAILTAQYTLFSKSFLQLNWLSSIKLPTGKVSHQDDRSIFLSPDMQSGSGSFDFINQISLSLQRIGNSNLNAETGLLIRINGSNKKFAATQNSPGRFYKFGNEFQIRSSLSRTILLKSWILAPDLTLQYRHARPNIENETIAPNSGGHWLNSQFGIFVLPKEKFSFRPYFSLPIYQQLNGLQITTKFAFGIDIGYKFNLSK